MSYSHPRRSYSTRLDQNTPSPDDGVHVGMGLRVEDGERRLVEELSLGGGLPAEVANRVKGSLELRLTVTGRLLWVGNQVYR